MNILIKHLTQMKKLYKNSKSQHGVEFYDWILKNGKLFTKAITPIEYREYKQCYYNSQTLALDGEGKYYEGWGTTKAFGFPVEHGFVVKRNKVLDNTWRDGENYFGVYIPNEYISKHWVESGMAESLLYYYYREKIKGEKI